MSLPSGWERSQTLKGIPYYINHRTENTFWNHPLISKVEKDMVSLNYIKYAAYRTAAKLRTIQKLTAASNLDLTIVKEYLEMHGLGSTSSLNQMITVGELKKMLDDIFVYQARQSRNFVRDPSEAAELTLNWILNVFNGKRLENVRVLSIKLALTVLCSGTPQYKYQYLFSQFQNRAGFMERERLGNFLKVCLQIPKYLNEQASFRNDSIEPAIRNCLEQSRIPGRAFQEDFVNWMLTEPQPLVWIPTLYRMAASETSKHEAKCNICKLFPIVGFRYKCVQCFNFDLCQDCFWTGRTSKGHNLGHPIQEYCLASTQKEDTKDFVKVLKNKLMNSKKEERRKNSNERYNPIPPDERQGNGKEYDADDDSIYQPISEYGSVDYQPRLDKSSNQRSEKEPSSWQPNGYPQPPKRYPSKGSLRSSRSSKEDYSVLQRRPPEDPISSPMRDDQRAVLEHIITTLEDDNRLMRQELQSVRKQQDEQSRPDDNPLSLEVKALKNEKQKMQSRQQMLEDHNRKLELQLQKLRMLLQQEQRQVNSMLEEEILQTCKRGPERSESNGSLQLPKNSTTATVMTNSHQNTVSGIDTRLDTPFLPLRSPYISPRSSEFYIPVQITSPEAVFPSSEAYRQEIKQGRGKLPSLTVRNASVKTSMPSPYHQFSWEESHTGDVDRLYRVEKVSEGMGRDVSARKASKEWEKSLEEEELEETVRWAMENFPSSSRCLSSPTKSLSNAAEGLSHSIEEIIATIDDSSSDTG